MDNENQTNIAAVKKKRFFSAWFTKKRVIWTVIILLAAGGIAYKIFKPKNPGDGILTDTVKKQDIKSTVLATGQVVSKTDLALSFKSGGIVQRVNVKEGDKVRAGTVLAILSQSDQLASLTQAQGALAQAQANYQKVLAGASSQDVQVAQAAVDAAQVAVDNSKKTLENAIQQQKVFVANAYSSLLNSGLAAIPQPGNIDNTAVTITGTYTGVDQGLYSIAIFNSGSGAKFTAGGLENASGDVKTVPVPLGTKGLFIQFSGINVSSADQWFITIPNTQAVAYVINYNAYQSALQTQKTAVDSAQSQINSAQGALQQAQAALDLKKAQARPADLSSAQAQILTAQGQVQAAQSALENAIVRAPADGTITQVDIKAGEQASPSKEVLILQDVGNLHIEANVSEANIASLKSGQTIDVTFDALGPDRHFKATVQTVNPASTVISGVVNYKVTAAVDNISEIKPGMTANMTILVGQKDNVLAIPQRAVISNGKKQVRVIDDAKKKTYHEVEVLTGMEADGGLVEIVSGLNQGQEIVTFIKQ